MPSEQPKMPNLLIRAQNTILSAAFILFISSGANAILGLVKNRLLAGKFGVSEELALFYTADRIPNLIYSVLVVGALSTVFIPIFMEKLKKNRENAFAAASTLINFVLVFFAVLCVISWIFAPLIINVLGVGSFSPEFITLGAKIMRIMLLSQFLLVAGSLASSVLQSYKLFIIPAIAPLAYNLGMIGGILWFSEQYGILGPSYGTLVGAIFHFAIQLPFIKTTGFKWSCKLDIHGDVFKEMMRLAPPRVLSVILSNALATVNNSFAILISSASVVYLKFGLQLQAFPVTLFGASIAAASLPTLAAEYDDKDYSKFRKTFLTSFHQMMFLVLPASAVFLVLRIPIVRLVYGVDNFPWEATINTALVLGVFTLSIFPQSAIYLITRAFYALKDTATPVKVSLITIIINVILSVFFIRGLKWEVWSVAFSFVITSLLDMTLMLYLLGKKIGGLNIKTVVIPFMKTAFATLLMALTLYIPIKLLDYVIIDTTRTINLLLLTGIASFCGGITYLLFTMMLKVPEIDLFYKLIRKVKLSVANIGRTDVETLQ
jgi:putative peptidoglycan lipid II flippase